MRDILRIMVAAIATAIWAILSLPTFAASVKTYRYVASDGVDYALNVWRPKSATSSSSLPALVFFHGGNWVAGNRSQFKRQALMITSRVNAVVISVDYPLHGDPVEATRSAHRLLCWLRAEAASLDIDTKRIAFSGGSAGGQVAVSAAMEEHARSTCKDGEAPRPALLILYNPILAFQPHLSPSKQQFEKVSPMRIARRKVLPPTLILQGTADRIASIKVARQFVSVARQSGSKVVETDFRGRQHGFFNNGRNGDLQATVSDTIKFMRAAGWFNGKGQR